MPQEPDLKLHCGNVLYSFTARWSSTPGNRTVLWEERPFKYNTDLTIRNLFSLSTASRGTNLLAVSGQSVCLKVRTVVQAYHLSNFYYLHKFFLSLRLLNQFQLHPGFSGQSSWNICLHLKRTVFSTFIS